MGFPRQEYWNGLPFSFPGQSSQPRDWPESTKLQVDSLPLSHQRSPVCPYIGNIRKYVPFNSVQFSHSVMSDSLQPHELQHARPPCPSLIPRFTQTHVHWVGDAIQPSHPLSSPSLPALNLSQHFKVSLFKWIFSNESALRIRWPKYWSFTFNICPSNEHQGLIFRMDCFRLLAVQGTLKSLLQHHSTKASILQHSAFFTVQLLYPYMTTGKTMALTRWTFVGKVVSLLFNMLSRLVITLLTSDILYLELVSRMKRLGH